MQIQVLNNVKALFIYLLFGTMLFLTGCMDDVHDHDDEHTDADGFVLEDESETEIYREFEGTIGGSIALSVGDTLELSVHFLDHDGNEIEHEHDHEDGEEDEEKGLLVSGYDSNIAVIEVEDHEEEGEEHHGMAIHVIGVGAGSTDFKLQLMHGDHADYTSTNNVPVVVN